MFAVIWEYRQRLMSAVAGIASETVAQRFVINVVVAFIPAVVFGLLLGKVIKEHLFRPVPVAAAFVIGGLVILWAEARHKRLYGARDLLGKRHARVETVDDMTPLDALKVGLVQCVALIPGTSRSGATIIGAMILGLSRRAATEFSFFLAIPTLIGAGVYSVWKQSESLVVADLPTFGVGLVFAFLSAWLCIRWLIRYISTHDFTAFGWYRIVFGGVIRMTAGLGGVDGSR
jgi:undecaprenyl-diphosphatase